MGDVINLFGERASEGHPLARNEDWMRSRLENLGEQIAQNRLAQEDAHLRAKLAGIGIRNLAE